jgi:hypothetical protein
VLDILESISVCIVRLVVEDEANNEINEQNMELDECYQATVEISTEYTMKLLLGG